MLLRNRIPLLKVAPASMQFSAKKQSRLTSKIKLAHIIDMYRKAIEEEKQRQALMQQVVGRISAIGRWPMDFAWRWEGDTFHCKGGFYYATHEQLGVSAETCSKLFSKTGVMDI
jgi:hypothetical protein